MLSPTLTLSLRCTVKAPVWGLRQAGSLHPRAELYKERFCTAFGSLWASSTLSVLLCRSASKSVLPVHLADGDGAPSQDSPHSQASSCSSFPGRVTPADAEGLQLECAHLRQENSRLLAENRQLGEQ